LIKSTIKRRIVIRKKLKILKQVKLLEILKNLWKNIDSIRTYFEYDNFKEVLIKEFHILLKTYTIVKNYILHVTI